MAGNDETLQTDSYRPVELAKALCAGDYAFLLREDCITNDVGKKKWYLPNVTLTTNEFWTLCKLNNPFK